MYLRTLMLTLVILLTLPAALVITVDPFNVWHDGGPAAGLYSNNQRFETPGHIRRYLECAKCKAGAVILIGTSVSENTTLEDLREATGNDNAVRLIIKGSYPIEQHYVLQRALASGHVSEVYWEIYRNYAKPDYDQFPGGDSFPVYLYDQDLLNDHHYLLNHGAVTRSVLLLLGRTQASRDVGRLNVWQGIAEQEGLFRKWNSTDTLSRIAERVAPRIEKWRGTHPDWNQPVPAFERFIQPVVEAYPDVRFNFFIAPVSLVRHGTSLGELLSGELVLRRKLAELAEQRPNVHLYAFDHYAPLVTDQAYYKDSGHYTAAVNRWMLERMEAEDPRFIVTPEKAVAQGEWIWRNAIEHVPFSSCSAEPARCGVFNPSEHSLPSAD